MTCTVLAKNVDCVINDDIDVNVSSDGNKYITALKKWMIHTTYINDLNRVKLSKIL